jgi:glucosamine 6-phosphate synthetase-like amidotransferase/phosphosugar isomerase protein
MRRICNLCAIFGFTNYGNIVQHKSLKKLLRVLSIESTVRGHDATGFGYCANGEIRIFKAPVQAKKLHLYFPTNTTSVIGHSRMATQGIPENNINNHPFPAIAGETSFALAHNGVIYNDKLLRITKQLPDTPIETDSYICCQLLESYGTLDFGSIKSMCEDLEGTFSLSIIDDKRNIYLIKGDSPLFLAHFEKLGLYVYTSTEQIFTKALLRTRIKHEPYTKIDITNGDILKITAEGLIERARFEVLELFCLNPRWSYDFNFLRKTEISHTTYLDELVELGTFAGVSREEIVSLYECGFMGCEIEELLSEPELLREQLCSISEDNDFTFDY